MRTTLAALAALVALPLAGCGSDVDVDPRAEDDRALTIYADTALEAGVTAVTEQFRAEHHGVQVTLSFHESDDLAAAATGAPVADLVITTPTTMSEAGAATEPEPEPIASDQLVLVTAPDNPQGIEGLSDITGRELALAVCDPATRCGAAAERVLTQTAPFFTPARTEKSAAKALAAVTAQEVDAAIVHQSDVAAADADVEVVDVSEADDAGDEYLAAVGAEAAEASLAREWIELAVASPGRRLLKRAGLTVP